METGEDRDMMDAVERLVHRVHILLYEGNPISLVLQNIDPPSLSPPGESVLPPQQRRGVLKIYTNICSNKIKQNHKILAPA